MHILLLKRKETMRLAAIIELASLKAEENTTKVTSAPQTVGLLQEQRLKNIMTRFHDL